VKHAALVIDAGALIVTPARAMGTGHWLPIASQFSS
jgi:hypothetical protein